MHPCPLCSRSFTRPENLSRHQKTHGKTLPHTCPTCRKQFSRSDLLKKHEAVHLKRGGQGGTGQRRGSRVDALAGGSSSPQSFPPSPPPALTPLVSGTPAASSNHVFGNHPQYDVPVGMERSFTVLGMEQPSSHAYVDFSSFSQPWSESGPTPQDWFTTHFYEAVHETAGFEAMLGEGIFIPDISSQGNGIQWQEHTEARAEPIIHRRGESDESDYPDDHPGSISRIPSPPNAPSNEDYWPFAWNPSSSTPGLRTQPINVSETDGLLQDYDPRFDISSQSWEQLKTFLEPSTPAGEDIFTVPSLSVTNLFIGLFFKFFSAQAPVLHEPTLDMHSLPPPLLAIMLVIGAKYSRLRHTRRFAIVALDRARRNLMSAIEDDSRLLRDLPVIYALALICYAGLWCGNKRSFEMAEALRGTVVTYIRRLPVDPPQSQPAGGAQAQWLAWRAAESRIRLRWFVFTVDGQFPALLNMRGMISVSEVAKWECPCDDEFWTAPTARVWKSLLGRASLPPSPVFAVASAPFVRFLHGRGRQEFSPVPRLNQWTAFLVLMAVSSQALDWSHNLALAVTLVVETVDETEVEESVAKMEHDPEFQNLIERRERLSAALDLWKQSYSRNPSTPSKSQPMEGGAFFYEASQLLHSLVRMLLYISITDLQEAIGKAGPASIDPAMKRLKGWFSFPSSSAPGTSSGEEPRGAGSEAVTEAIRMIASIGDSPSAQSAVPYSIIGLFLSHVVLWAFAATAPPKEKRLLRGRLDDLCQSSGSAKRLVALLRTVADEGFRPQRIFRHAAHMLTRLGTWGASLNLALLLHRRSEL